MTFRKKSLVALAALAVVTGALGWRHHALAEPNVGVAPVAFETVDNVYTIDADLFIEGIRIGEATVTQYQAVFFTDRGRDTCLRFALLAQAKPGKYNLKIWTTANTGFDGCGLELRAP